MNVLVDSSVWSLALRRDAPRGTVEESELRELVREGRVLVIGPIRQELLSGIRSGQFNTLRERLRAFPDLPLHESDFEGAAVCHNRCRSRGVQGSHTDFLLCAVSLRHAASIFTTDADFVHCANVLGLELHRPRVSS